VEKESKELRMADTRMADSWVMKRSARAATGPLSASGTAALTPQRVATRHHRRFT
jgi:hypothetical protein